MILVFVFRPISLGHFAELMAINKGLSLDGAVNLELCPLAKLSSLTKQIGLHHCSRS